MGKPLIADENGVRWITLDRPEIRNALYAEDLARIRQAVTGIGDSVKAIVLTGSGESAFSAALAARSSFCHGYSMRTWNEFFSVSTSELHSAFRSAEVSPD